MGMEDLSIDITYDPCEFLLDSTFKKAFDTCNTLSYLANLRDL